MADIEDTSELFKIEAPEYLKDPEALINESHQQIANAILQIREEVLSAIESDDKKLDLSGHTVYAFDASKVSEQQVMDLQGTKPDLVAFEIDFSPPQEIKTEVFSSYSDNSPKERRGGGTTKEAEVAQLRYTAESGHPPVILELLPIAQRNPEWTTLQTEPKGLNTSVDLNYPTVVSSTKNGEVIVNGMRPKDVARALDSVEQHLSRVAEVMNGVKDRKYHYRIIGISGKRDSEQTPHFIIAKPRGGLDF